MSSDLNQQQNSQEAQDNDGQLSAMEIDGYNDKKEFFETNLASEATFQINSDDWIKLKSFQKGHRFMKGEWEDYFVYGMKESNKFCVFAFKDHYVNQASVRPALKPSKLLTANSGSSKKNLFSAQGYCVFQDCSVKFFLRMSGDRVVHVQYVGELKHSCSEVRARHFRGKSRRELGEALKNSTPLREFKKNTKNSSGGIAGGEAGNADYVGKTLSVYKRISAEVKDSYQTLLALRKQFIENSVIQISKLKLKVDYQSKLFDKTYVKGFIQVIQHMPGTIVCFSHEQVCLYHNIFLERISHINLNHSSEKTLGISDKSTLVQPCLYITCNRRSSVTSTTINSKDLFFYEMCVRKPVRTGDGSSGGDFSKSQNLVPLSFMLTTSTNSLTCLGQWLSLFFNTERNLFHNYYVSGKDRLFNHQDHVKYIICDNSMPLIETLLAILNKQTFASYSNECFSYSVNQSNLLQDQIDSPISNDLDQELTELNATLLRSIQTLKQPGLSSTSYVVHTCTNQVMTEISHLCKFYYSFGNKLFNHLYYYDKTPGQLIIIRANGKSK